VAGVLLIAEGVALPFLVVRGQGAACYRTSAFKWCHKAGWMKILCLVGLLVQACLSHPLQTVVPCDDGPHSCDTESTTCLRIGRCPIPSSLCCCFSCLAGLAGSLLPTLGILARLTPSLRFLPLRPQFLLCCLPSRTNTRSRNRNTRIEPDNFLHLCMYRRL
jgi:hypothetical protein